MPEDEGRVYGIRLSGVVRNSIVNGPGVRIVYFAQGCPHHCPGCHNPETHAPLGGTLYSIRTLADLAISDPLLDGITLSGGEPFEQPEAMSELVTRIRTARAELNVWAWSGYMMERLMEDPRRRALAELCDVIVDGPFVRERRTLDLPWRGSDNQRIIEVWKFLHS